MINPLRGLYLNNRFYDYLPDSFKETFKLRNTVTETTTSPNVSTGGASYSNFTMTIRLDNSYSEKNGDTIVGSTTWLGVSRLVDLKTFAGAKGVSNPIVFVTPYGVTFNVVPVGELDIDIFNPDNPSASGTEFRVSISLAQV